METLIDLCCYFEVESMLDKCTASNDSIIYINIINIIYYHNMYKTMQA